MKRIYENYLAADSAERQSMLLEAIRTQRFDSSLIQVIATESPAFIAEIALPLYQDYPYLFDTLLCDVAASQGLSNATRILQQIHFADHVTPIDLAQIDTFHSSDNNPLYVFYHRYGPEAFIDLYESETISLRQLYLWVRTQNAPPNPDHEQFILALAKHYAHDFTRAPAALSECLITECDIASAHDQVYYLESHLPFFGQLLDQLGMDGFCDFLTYFGAKLRRRPAHEMIENVLYCEFLKYISLTHSGPIDDRKSICPRFWIWLLDHASELSDIRDLLLLLARGGSSRP